MNNGITKEVSCGIDKKWATSAKPCPFCGSEAIGIMDKWFFDELVKDYPECAPLVDVECQECLANVREYGDSFDYEERAEAALKMWNTRRER